MRTFLYDLRLAVRNLGRSPGFFLIAAATLAIGIGANTAIFSIVNAILLQPLPFRNPGQLLRLYESESAPGKYPFAGQDYLDWKARNTTFQDMALFGYQRDMNLSGAGQPERVLAVPTEAGFFSLLGVQPLLGRTWVAGEDQPGKTDVAILSYGLWRSRFAGDPHAVGETIELNSRKHRIVGVMRSDFRFPTQAQLWVPLDMSPKGVGPRGSHWASAIGRMKPGVSVQAALADLTGIAAALEKQFPDSNHKVGAIVVPLHEDLIGKSRDSLLLMLGAVGLVLLIACANVANLLLSRAVARQKEMAVRSALGAGRWRLVRQLLTETGLLALIGAAVGLALGWGLIQAFAQAKGVAVPRFATIRIDLAVLAFTSALAVVTGILFGIYPAFQTSRPGLHDELRGGSGSSVSAGRRRRFTSNALVVAEFALSLVLLASAGLLLKDFARLRRLDIGVRTEGVWTGAVRLPDTRYAGDEKTLAFGESLLERVRRIPGVDAAALSSTLPLEGGSNYYIHVRGRVFQRMSGPLVERHLVTPDYFRTLGLRLLKGRYLTPADTQTVLAINTRVRELYKDEKVRPSADQTDAVVYPVVINDAMAKIIWPNEDPIGQRFSSGNQNGPWRQVVGIVSDARQRGLTEKASPEAYDLFVGQTRFVIVLHTARKPESLTPDVRRSLAQLDSTLPLFAVRTMDEVLAEKSVGQRFLSALIAAFAAIAALLAAIGIYGVLSYVVTQRTREIGIRMALGATRGRVLGEVLRQGAWLALIGFALGGAGAIAAGRLLANVLYEVQPRDPAVLLTTAALLGVVAVAACYLPARRAAALDPMRALHHE